MKLKLLSSLCTIKTWDLAHLFFTKYIYSAYQNELLFLISNELFTAKKEFANSREVKGKKRSGICVINFILNICLYFPIIFFFIIIFSSLPLSLLSVVSTE